METFFRYVEEIAKIIQQLLSGSEQLKAIECP